MPVRRVVARGLTAAVLIASPLAVASSASARGGVTQVDGLLVPDAAGADAVCQRVKPFDAAYTVSGTLEGCWFIDSTVYEHANSAGGFVATGTEEFRGCLAGTSRCGSFFTTYTFTAKYDGAQEIHGRCHHPIAGGNEDFAGAGGVINMHDLPNGCAVYTGHLDL